MRTRHHELDYRPVEICSFKLQQRMVVIESAEPKISSILNLVVFVDVVDSSELVVNGEFLNSARCELLGIIESN